MAYAYFAGGCFWCIAPVFHGLPGVVKVLSGYSGGDEINPSYEDVKMQRTHHRETIRIEYDETQVSYESLIGLFLQNVDPFDGGGQYIDRGASYTLAVYYTGEGEKETALRRIRQLEKEARCAACISIEPFKSFYTAEECHQDFHLKYPERFEEEMTVSGRKAR